MRYSLTTSRRRVALTLCDLLILCVALAALVVITVGVITKGTNVPFMDHWDLSYHVAVAVAKNEFSLDVLFMQNNEHRMIFTNLITTLLTVTTRWNSHLEMVIVVGLAGVNLCLLLLLTGMERLTLRVLVIPFTWLVFSFRQYENWLFSIQTNYIGVIFFQLLGIVALQRGRVGWRSLIVATGCATCASFTLFSGIMAWPIFLVGLWWVGYRNWRHYAFWIASASVALVFFFSGYQLPPSPGSSAIFAPLQQLAYIGVSLANPFFSNVGTGALIPAMISLSLLGLVLLAANSVALWTMTHTVKPMAPWWIVTAIAFAAAILTSLRRAQLGLEQAGSSRYVAFSSLFWIAVLALGWFVARNSYQKRVWALWQSALVAANVLTVIGLAFLYIRANRLATLDFDQYANARREGEACLIAYPVTKNATCLQPLFPDPALITDKIVTMARYQLGPFATQPHTQTPIIGFTPTGTQLDTRFTTYRIGLNTLNVLFQHPPSRVVADINVPDTPDKIILQSSIFVDTANVVDHPDIPQDGVKFTINVVTREAARRILFTQSFDPNTQKAPIPFTVDLSAYRGQPIFIEFSTDEQRNGNFDWAMWVAPQLETR